MEVFAFHVLLLTVTIATAVLAQTENADRVSRCYATCRSYTKRSKSLCLRYLCRLAVLGYFNRFGKRGTVKSGGETPEVFPWKSRRRNFSPSEEFRKPRHVQEENMPESFSERSLLRTASLFGQLVPLFGQSPRGNVLTVQPFEDPYDSVEEADPETFTSSKQRQRKRPPGRDWNNLGLPVERGEGLVRTVEHVVNELGQLAEEMIDSLQRVQLQDLSPGEPFRYRDKVHAFWFTKGYGTGVGNELDEIMSAEGPSRIRVRGLFPGDRKDMTEAEPPRHTYYRFVTSDGESRSGLQLNNLPQRKKYPTDLKGVKSSRTHPPGFSFEFEQIVQTPKPTPLPPALMLLLRGKTRSRMLGRWVATKEPEAGTFSLRQRTLPPKEVWDAETVPTEDNGRNIVDGVLSATKAQADLNTDRLGEVLALRGVGDITPRRAVLLLPLSGTDLRSRHSF